MAKQTDPNPLGYTLQRAADRLSVSPNTLRKLVAEGSIPVIHCGKRLIVPVKALEVWVDEQAKRADEDHERKF